MKFYVIKLEAKVVGVMGGARPPQIVQILATLEAEHDNTLELHYPPEKCPQIGEHIEVTLSASSNE